MEAVRKLNPLKAAWLLLFATVFWGLSFVIQKALIMAQQKVDPGANTWLLTSLSIIFRFAPAGIFLLLWNWRQVRGMTWLEFYEGAGLGVFGGLGLLFQMDGVNYTSASTAAFLTQCYCIFIPLLVACRNRQWPSRQITISTAMVFSGVAILSQIDFTELEVGRGELETLVASLFFTGQILWLERPIFAKNNTANFTIVMFLVTVLIFLPVPFVQSSPGEIAELYREPAPWVFSLVLMVFCTGLAYGLMNFWQPHISATQAGLIYCTEPVFTSIFALFLPGLFSAFAGIEYNNETITRHQIIGGGLILFANMLVLLQAARARPESEQRMKVLEVQ